MKMTGVAQRAHTQIAEYRDILPKIGHFVLHTDASEICQELSNVDKHYVWVDGHAACHTYSSIVITWGLFC